MVLSGLDGAGARRAADARIAAIVQRAVVELMHADVAPDVSLRPVEQRADLRQPGLLVPGYRLRCRALLGLFAPHARHPGAIAGDGPDEGLDLADLAAADALAEAVIEAIDAVLAHVALHRLRIRVIQLDAALVAALQALQQRQRLLGQSPGIDTDDVDAGYMHPDQVGQHHCFGAQATGIDHAAVRIDRLAQQRKTGGSLGSQRRIECCFVTSGGRHRAQLCSPVS